MSNQAAQTLLTAVACETATAVDIAVESWMADIENAITDPHLTSLGRLHAVQDALQRYKDLTGKASLVRRRAAVSQLTGTATESPCALPAAV